MKRNINLQELSKDHHHGLLLGWKIRKGLNAGIELEEIANYTSYFFREALLPHFEEEENLILSHLAADNELKLIILAEHQQIINTFESLMLHADGEKFLNLATDLERHIRFEERVLFPYLELKLSSQQLNEIGKSISTSHHSFSENYHYEFWKNN